MGKEAFRKLKDELRDPLCRQVIRMIKRELKKKEVASIKKPTPRNQQKLQDNLEYQMNLL